MTEITPIIQLTDITFHYPGREPVLKDLSFKMYAGDRLGIIAPNGSGKTTLLHLIMGLIKPAEGVIHIFGEPVSEEKDFLDVRRKIGLLFQDADDQLFSPTVLEDVAFGPLNLGYSRKDAVRITIETLDFLGLNGFEDRITAKLSGGEKRLVSLATVLAMKPKVLLLDEPLSGLDTDTREKITEILSELDLSLIVISHEIDFLTTVTDHIYTVENGRILLEEELHVHRHAHAHRHGKVPHKHHE
jgi:cobalt/nickel transport system ATP-binding protein